MDKMQGTTLMNFDDILEEELKDDEFNTLFDKETLKLDIANSKTEPKLEDIIEMTDKKTNDCS